MGVDVFVPSLRKAIEYDGSRWHASPELQRSSSGLTHLRRLPYKRRMRIEVHHTYCGCECNACGHEITVYPYDDDRRYRDFRYEHSEDTNPRSFAYVIVDTFLRRYHPELLSQVDWPSIVVDVATDEQCYL